MVPRRSPRRPLIVALALGGIALAPAIGQDRPESLLPPGFSDPAPAPSARPTTLPDAAASPAATDAPAPLPSASPTATPSPTPTPDAAMLALYEMPLAARRSLDLVGPATPREGGLAADAFAGANGPLVEGLMRRVAAPLPSRWLSILLRRTLASRLTTPRGVDGADFAAERAWLLLRMGEAAAARGVVQGVDTANYTPKLTQVAMNAMLATGDVGGLCPLTASGTGERGWVLARAMCTSLSGNAREGGRQITAARRRRVASGIDLLLAQKVAGAGGDGRQAVTIEWNDVVQLTSWRWGLATATGVAVPDALYDTAGPQMRHWRSIAAGVPVALRLPVADAAAAQGVLSNLALVDLYAAALDEEGTAPADRGTAQDLATAYADRTAVGRIAAIRAVWGSGPQIPYGRLVLTARAAARLPIAESAAADLLVSSMLSAGLDRAAVRWRSVVPSEGDAWAMIALADPDARAPLSYSDMSGYGGGGGGDTRFKQRLFFAGLAGLGRLAPDDVERGAEVMDVRIGTANSWTRVLDRAAANGEQGTVVVLAAIGMQTGAWRGVPPEMLYRIVGALRAVGLEGEARMIAAEAIARA